MELREINCNYTRKFVNIREKWRNIIAYQGSIYFAVNFGVIEDFGRKFKNFENFIMFQIFRITNDIIFDAMKFIIVTDDMIMKTGLPTE